MAYFKLVLSYDGTDFQGWQIQASGPTIQAELEEAWLQVCSEKIRATASGRTDSGVHAWEQVVHFDTAVSRSPNPARSEASVRLRR